MKTLRIYDCYKVQGDFYEVGHGECGPIHVYDLMIETAAADGKRYRLRDYLVRGWFTSEDGFAAPDMYSNERAAKMADRVARRGFIDLALWDEVVEKEPETCECHGWPAWACASSERQERIEAGCSAFEVF